MFGYTRIYFFPERGRIKCHAGEFLDKEHNSSAFFATRIRYKAFQRRLTDPDKKLEAARSFWATIEPKITQGRELRIDRDFV